MTPEIEALLVKLAGRKRECVFCRGTGYTHEPFAGRGQGGQNDPDGKYVCEGCHGTGEVYILDVGVRVPCTPIEYFDAGAYSACEKSRPCSKCAGRGWTPSLDFVTWWNALYAAGYNLKLVASVNTPSLNGAHVYRSSGEVNLEAERILAALARR